MNINIKELIRSKTFYAGIIEIIGGIAVIMLNGDNLGGIEQIGGGVCTALGLSSIFLRDTLSNITKK